MNNENSKESGFNWTGGSWPAYCTTIEYGRVVGKVWRGDDGLLHAMVLKGMSKGFETIGYYIDIYGAQDAVERWVKDNRPGLVPNTDDTPEHTPKHTPGPLQYAFESGTVAFIVEADGTTVAKISTTANSTANSRLPANVQLFAAAPEMLNALIMVLDDPNALDGRPRTAEIVYSAIAKAEGRQG